MKAALAQAPAERAPENQTKRQRQNAAKHAADKAAKEEVEADRLARLAQHKRTLEKEKIASLYSKSNKAIGGGSNPYVDDKGKLVFP